MVKIITDSTTDLTAQIKDSVITVPLTVRFGDTEYADGITITKNEFYERLIESDTLPTTSQPTPDLFTQQFEKIKASGDTAVVITVSSKLSGTYQSAMIAASDYEDRIFVVDSKSVAIGTAILTEYALSLVKSGMSASEIYDALIQKRDEVCVIGMLDTLEYLKKGGRISSAVAFAGGLLMIKPVICLDDGEIKMLGKARGSKQANNLLAQEIQNSGGVNFDMPILTGFTGLSDILLKKYISDSEDIWMPAGQPPRYVQIGSVIGTHAGPGAIAVAFFKNNK